MSDDMYEVAFSGQVAEGADLEQVKAKVGQMFKADAAKLAHLFSGKRVVIKKNIDQPTAMKYQSALDKVGAVCEIKNLSSPEEASIATPEVKQQSEVSESGMIKATTPDIDIETPPAPVTEPLHISANDISDLSASVADLGSDMQDEIKEIEAPDVDLSGLDMAPVGSDMADHKEEDFPPTPDTTGLEIVD
jgi:hypothetical protein